METATIRAVIYQEGDIWVAQCIDYDISAQARTVTDAYRRLSMTIQLEREFTASRGSALNRIPAAPEFFHELYRNAGGAYQPAGSYDHVEAKLAA